jgi:hypothetical protein
VDTVGGNSVSRTLVNKGTVIYIPKNCVDHNNADTASIRTVQQKEKTKSRRIRNYLTLRAPDEQMINIPGDFGR